MPLTKPQKQEIVRELTDKFNKKKIAIFNDLRGISVAKSQVLRRQLKKNEAEFKVAKKTLLDISLRNSGLDAATKKLEGEIGVVFGYGDEVAPAKTLLKFSKENETFKILGGILRNKFISGQEIIKLAKLPAREILLASLLRALQSPARGLVNVLSGNAKNLVVVLQKIADKKGV